ncbi:MAG TPA: anhydro-N-acetylmuramic acid kinase [Chitinophagaceae bacterium]|nr:anhydro-N-acetylmuramic acid kinase [Chitinophagaceae bacterium]
MVYRVIGLMSGSSLDGLDIAYVQFQETGGKWTYEIVQAGCYPYDDEWMERLSNATQLNARDYLLLHTDYGRYIGQIVQTFIMQHSLQYQVQLIASHGHTTFHIPARKMTGQLGDGAAIAAETGINTVTDLRAMDIALGGQGAPIVPIGEKILLSEYGFCLNLGGIANISLNDPGQNLAFDVCPANRVLNLLATGLGKSYDEGGNIARSGKLHEGLLQKLNALDYYSQPYPKSLANDFGTDTVYPLIKASGVSVPDGLRTYAEHIALQIKQSAASLLPMVQRDTYNLQLLATGGGAFNQFLMERLTALLQPLNISVVIPDENLVQYKEALIMALMGVLRWREENNVLASVTGASRNSIGGAVWMGQEA